MNFPLKIIDVCCQVREKYKRPDFIIGYRLSPEEPFETGITMTETNLLKFLSLSHFNIFIFLNGIFLKKLVEEKELDKKD